MFLARFDCFLREKALYVQSMLRSMRSAEEFIGIGRPKPYLFAEPARLQTGAASALEAAFPILAEFRARAQRSAADAPHTRV